MRHNERNRLLADGDKYELERGRDPRELAQEHLQRAASAASNAADHATSQYTTFNSILDAATAVARAHRGEVLLRYARMRGRQQG